MSGVWGRGRDGDKAVRPPPSRSLEEGVLEGVVSGDAARGVQDEDLLEQVCKLPNLPCQDARGVNSLQGQGRGGYARSSLD